MKNRLTYKEYLKKLNKSDLTTLLENYHIAYKKNASVASLENLIEDNLDKMVDYSFDMFQYDEYLNLKYLIKKKGVVKVELSHYLTTFLNNLEKNYLVVKENEKIYYMPVELLNTFKKKIKSKKVLEKVKNNTNEYNLLLGFIATYGVIDFEFFYNKFSTTYNYEKDELLTKVKNLSAFYNEFKVFTDKTNLVYIASNSLKNMTEIKKYFKTDEYKEFSNEEILNIYTFKYMEKFLSYKKLKKFIDRHYYVEKGSFKVINRFVLLPYIYDYQIDTKKAKKNLNSLIDKYFEFKSDKHKEKFISLIENMALDYPKWTLKGNSERKKKNVKKDKHKKS